jgi:hypothetical protein
MLFLGEIAERRNEVGEGWLVAALQVKRAVAACRRKQDVYSITPV